MLMYLPLLPSSSCRISVLFSFSSSHLARSIGMLTMKTPLFTCTFLSICKKPPLKLLFSCSIGLLNLSLHNIGMRIGQATQGFQQVPRYMSREPGEKGALYVSPALPREKQRGQVKKKMGKECFNCSKAIEGVAYRFDGLLYCGKSCLVKRLTEGNIVKLEIIKQEGR